MTFLLTILQPTALVILQHPMLAAEMARAETTVANDALCGVFAIFERAAQFLATSDGGGQVDRGGWEDVERGKRG